MPPGAPAGSRAARRMAKCAARPWASSAMAGSGVRWRAVPSPFGCRILAANRTPRPAEPGVERVYPLAELDRILPECDTVALCTALGPETTGLIDARRLALMKPGAFLINIARGQVVDEDALYAALRDRRIGGAAIDVWWQYPDRRRAQSPRLAPPVPRIAERDRNPAQFRLDRGHDAAAVGRGGRKPRPLCARRAVDQHRHRLEAEGT